MKFLGLKLEVKREARYVRYEDLEPVYQALQELDKRIETVRKAGESLRVRFSKAKIPTNGDESDLEPMFPVPQENRQSQFNTGDPWPG